MPFNCQKNFFLEILCTDHQGAWRDDKEFKICTTSFEFESGRASPDKEPGMTGVLLAYPDPQSMFPGNGISSNK